MYTPFVSRVLRPCASRALPILIIKSQRRHSLDKLVLADTHANPDAQRNNLAPDISVYAADNVPDADAKTDF